MFERLLGGLDHRISRTVRKTKNLRNTVQQESFKINSTAGYPIHATLSLPTHIQAPYPVLLLCPGINDSGDVFTHYQTPIQIHELCRLGIATLHFDPAGRGQSWGEEDFGGQEHQDNVSELLRYLANHAQIDTQKIGIISISLGISMAVGGAIQSDVPLLFLLDWEGPSDREIITSGGTRMAPAMGHKLSDDDYWKPREAVNFIQGLNCGYIRLQAQRDHAQPNERRHMWRMLRAAQGHVPWFQLNHHLRDNLPERPKLLLSNRLSGNRAICRIAKSMCLK